MDTIKVKVGIGIEMEAKARVFEPKNWLYLEFGQGRRVCIDIESGQIITGQCHRAPGLVFGERERIAALYR